MRVLKKISDIVNFLVEHVIAILMGLMTIVVFLQVVFRLISGSLPWSEELARYMMIFMVYLGASVGVKMKNHIAVEFVVNKLPGKGRTVIDIIADILMLVCFAVIIHFGLSVVKVTMMQKSPVLRVKMGYVYFSIVLGGILMCLQTVVNLVHSLRNLFTGQADRLEGPAVVGIDVGDVPEEKGGM
ncbi:MAG: TRAP transporter small permease [Oscillospiraceae bacterium]|nr:TRAP transporter small permease [Oscillospiraceae bacterium]